MDGSSPDSISDTARIDLPGAYTVSFSGDPDPIGALTLANAANVTFASSSRTGNPIVPRTLQLVNTGGGAGSLTMTGSASLALGATSGGIPSTSNPFHLTADGDLTVGFGSTLNVRFGSDVVASKLVSGGQVNVSGSGSTLNASTSVEVNGGLNITTGGLLQNVQDANIGNQRSGLSTATVSGVGSQWLISELLSVGAGLGQGTLNIKGGGSVSNTHGFLGASVESNGMATVTGGAWTMTGRLSIGGSSFSNSVGGFGSLNIQPAAIVSAAEGVVLFPDGHVNLQGGILDTSAISFFQGM